MTKSDLRTGMIVELRNEERYMVLKEEKLETYSHVNQLIMFVNQYGFMDGDGFNDDLKDNGYGYEYNIVKIYKPCIRAFKYLFDDCDSSNLIWERKKENIKIPMSDVFELLKDEYGTDNIEIIE